MLRVGSKCKSLIKNFAVVKNKRFISVDCVDIGGVFNVSDNIKRGIVDGNATGSAYVIIAVYFVIVIDNVVINRYVVCNKAGFAFAVDFPKRVRLLGRLRFRSFA